jgi:hypothetical protein
MAILSLVILSLDLSLEHLQSNPQNNSTQYLFFNCVGLLDICFCWLFSKPLTVVCWHSAAFLSCQAIIYSPDKTKNGCQVGPLLLNLFCCYTLAKWVLIGTDSHLNCPKLPLQCQEHSGKAFLHWATLINQNSELTKSSEETLRRQFGDKRGKLSQSSLIHLCQDLTKVIKAERF